MIKIKALNGNIYSLDTYQTPLAIPVKENDDMFPFLREIKAGRIEQSE